MAIARLRRRFSVDEYERMVEAGVLTEDDRAELLAGEMVKMSPIGIRHMNCVNRAAKIFGRALADELILSVQNPIRLANDGMPQPDLAVFADRGADAPMPIDAEVLIAIEVADSTRDSDRQPNCRFTRWRGSRKPGSSIWLRRRSSAISRHLMAATR